MADAATSRKRKNASEETGPAQEKKMKKETTFPIDPKIELHSGFPPEKVNVAEYISGRTVVLLGLPGAFTPTWSSVQIPGYLKNEAELKKRGVEEVMVYCVNDGAVMKAWGEKQKIGGSFLKFFGDPYSDLTRSLDMVLDHPGPRGVGLINRCKRFVILFSKGEAKFKAIAESADDPAGDSHPDKTLAEAVIKFMDGTDL